MELVVVHQAKAVQMMMKEQQWMSIGSAGGIIRVDALSVLHVGMIIDVRTASSLDTVFSIVEG